MSVVPNHVGLLFWLSALLCPRTVSEESSAIGVEKAGARQRLPPLIPLPPAVMKTVFPANRLRGRISRCSDLETSIR